MKKLLSILSLLVAVNLSAATARTIRLPGSSPFITSQSTTATVELLQRSEYRVRFVVRINQFTVESSVTGVKIRVGGINESQPGIGYPDISSVTVFIPFNSPVTGKAIATAKFPTLYTPLQLDGIVAIASDLDQPDDHRSKTAVSMPLVNVGEAAVFKDFGVIPVTVYPIRELADGTIEANSEVEIDLSATPTGNVFTSPILRSFDQIYETTFLGYPNFSIGRSKLWRPGSYLIVRPPNPDYNAVIRYFVQEKQLAGFNVIVRNIPMGATANDIKSIIETVYREQSHILPVEYVVLLGDADRLDNVPTFPYTLSASEIIPTDLDYVLLDGNDFWPEAMIGRIPFGSVTGLATIINKSVDHHNSPGLHFYPSRNRAFSFAGNYSLSPSVIDYSRWTAQLLADQGYDTTTYFCPPQPMPGTDSVLVLINRGNSVITYMGLSDSQGLLYPRLQKTDLSQVNRDDAILYSMGCQSGRFAALNATVDDNQCFGEAWIEAGTPAIPKCGPAFYGATHLHTSNRYNPTLLAGTMHGWLNEKLDKLGTATLRGKLELYRNFPNEWNAVEGYFRSYHILGDPSLQLWYGVPDTLTVTIPDQINSSMSSITLHVFDHQTNQPQPNLTASLIVGPNADNQAVGITDASGTVTLPLRVVPGDFVFVMVCGNNFLPSQFQFYVLDTVSTSFRVDSLHYNNTASLPNPGENGDLQVYVKNVGSTSVIANATLFDSSETNRISILQDTSNAGTVNPGGTAMLSFRIRVNSLRDRSPISLYLNFSGQEVGFALPVNWINPMVDRYECLVGSLNPGENDQTTLQLQISNRGSAPIPQCNWRFESDSDVIQILSGTIFNPVIADSGTIDLTLRVRSNAMPGQVVPIRTLIYQPNGPDTLVYQITLTCGERSQNMPTGPDIFGYFAYEEIDTVVGNSVHPIYRWIELDTALGGSGEPLELGDDQTVTLALPFDFRFYDRLYPTGHAISICSNGWISFDSTNRSDYLNHALPYALGPRSMIAANWDDLRGSSTDSENVRVFTQHRTIQNDHSFVIEWASAYSQYGFETLQQHQKFEIVLYTNPSGSEQNSVIDIFYHTASEIDQSNNYTTVGIMNWERTDGLQVAFANILAPGSEALHNSHAIRFTTARLDAVAESGNLQTNILPNVFGISSVYPNPFNNATTIDYNLSHSGNVKLILYDLSGREIRALEQGFRSVGKYRTQLNGTGLASGTYFLKLSNGKENSLRKIVLLK